MKSLRRFRFQTAALGVFLALFAVVCLSATPARGDDSATDLARLQGTWNLISVLDEGSPAPPEALKGATAVFAGDKMTLVSPDGRDRTEYSVKLDASKTPKTIDLTPLAGSFKDQTNKAIYDLQGDVLRICQPEKPSQPRPAAFDAPVGSSQNLMTLKKAAK
jgi:uncharacterized protein (TIGR03067 family)